VGRVRADADLPVQVSAAEEVWYDLARWPSFVEGFHHVDKVDGTWPRAGARVVWDSIPAGRGRVAERVVSYEVRTGQQVEVEDPRMTGVQSVAFTPRPGGGSHIAVELEYRLKGSNALLALADVVFIRRSLRDALRRTVERFVREVRADAELRAVG
jgi:uncharacterized membrane protein